MPSDMVRIRHTDGREAEIRSESVAVHESRGWTVVDDAPEAPPAAAPVAPTATPQAPRPAPRGVEPAPATPTA